MVSNDCKTTRAPLAEVAKQAHCSLALVSRKRKQGKSDAQIEREGVARWKREQQKSPKVTPEAADDETRQPSGGEEPESFADAQRRKEAALADLRELELRSKRGELVDAAEVALQWGQVCSQVRDAMLAIPPKAAPKLAGMTNEREIAFYLRGLIRDSLTKISRDLAEQGKAAR